MTITLKQLLVDINEVELHPEQQSLTTGPLKLDSRQIEPGDTFIAVTGHAIDARQFIAKAFESGATLVIAEASDYQQCYPEFVQDKRLVWVAHLAEQTSQLASNYYDHPSESLKAIGVTGTNGKTSCSYLIAKTLQQMNFECFLLGTLGVGQSNQLQSTATTTADAITLQKVLAQAVNNGAQFAAMELSSHGIVQKRAAAVKIVTAIFTNLTRDHLDYHGSMENYGESKRLLFVDPALKNAVINMDDKFGRQLANDEQIVAKKWLVTTKSPSSGSNLDRWIWAEDVAFSMQGLHAKVYTPWGSGKLNSPLIGRFNLSNLLLVIAALGSIIKDVHPILDALIHVDAAPGRMQKIGHDKSPLVIIDYAHTPDALEQTLLAIREHCVGLIWCIFGCGGDRDSGKRPLMASIAEKLANKVIVTSDNPRTESPQQIRDDIFAGFRRTEKVKYIVDRAQAINEVIAQANIGDAILIAGKGHEDYQILGVQKHYFSDLEVANQAIEAYSGAL